MSSVVAIVKSIVGQVFAVSPEGVRRVLVEGDRLFVGDQVDTGAAGAVTLELADGKTLDLGRDTQWSGSAPDSSSALAEATAQAAPSVEELQQAIVAGADPTKDLEATAAGPTATGTGGAAGGGHSFVMLDATAGRVDPTIGFPTAGFGTAALAEQNTIDGQTADFNPNLQRESTLSLSATSTITEAGGVLVYTATLTQAPLTNLAITLSNGSVIVIQAGQLTGNVSVPLAPNDTVYNDPTQIDVSVTGTTGGNGIIVTPPTTPAVTQVTDTVDTTTVTLTAGANVTEGGVITYTATLTSPAQTPVTITLSNGSVITIDAGNTFGTVNVPTAANDVYTNGSTVTTTITGATGGNFENLVPNPTPAVTTITDSIDNTGLNLTATGSIVEGGQITYTATLTNPAGTPMTVTLSNGSVITIEAGKTTGSVIVDTANNDVYNNGSTVSTTITGTTGGNFEQLTPSAEPALTTITDSVDNTGLSLTATGSIVEGGQITYTATLTNPAGTPMTVTLSNGSVITIEAGKTSGSVIVYTANNDVYNNGSTVSTTITGTTGGNFEQLTPSAEPALTTITDSRDDTGLSLTATGSIVEGGQITYTATLTNPAGTPMTVTLSNGSVITIEAGKTSGSVIVDTANNDVYNNSSTVSTTITGTTGGNFEQLTPSAEPALTTITDSRDDTGLSLSASPEVAEGGQILYTATLTNPAGTPVTVTLSNGAVITIAAGATTGSVSVPAPVDDVYKDAGKVEVTIQDAAGGNFENLITDPAAAVTSVTDTLDTSTVSLTATPDVAEGGTVVYTASVTAPVTGSPVVVTLSNGQSIIIPVGESSASVNFTAPNDVLTGGASLSVKIDDATGGNYEKLEVDGTSADTSVTDTPDTTTVSLSATESVAEGGSIVYTANLTNTAGTAMTVTLSNGAVINIAAGATSGSVTFAAPTDDVYKDAGKVEVTIKETSGGNFENLVADNSPAVTEVTDTVDATTVSLTATGNVNEGGSIIYTASLTTAAGTPVTVTLSNGATITIDAGKTTGTVKVDAPKDDVYKDAGKVEVTIKDAVGGNFENLVKDPAPAVTNVADTTNTTRLTLSSDTVVLEGSHITYTATLTHAAQTPVTVHLSNGESITIAAGKTSGSVTIAAPSDDVYRDTGLLAVKMTDASGGNFEKLDVSNVPAITIVFDTINTTVLSLSASNTVSEGGQITYTATLTNPTDTAMTVKLSNGAIINIAAGAASGSVNFAAPADTPYTDGGKVAAIIVGHSGGNFENVAVNYLPAVTTVTDTADTTGLSLSATSTVAEGGSIVYTATLTNAAGTAMNVTLSNGAVIHIAKGALTGSVNYAAPSDDVYNDAGQVQASITKTTGGNFENLVADTTPAVTQVTDTVDATTVSLTATGNVNEGGTIVYTATLTNAAGTAMTVTLSNGAVINIAKDATSGSVTFAAPKDDVYKDAGNVEASITKTTGGNFENLVVNSTPAVTNVADTTDTTRLTLSADLLVLEGSHITYTATLSHAAQTPVTVTLSNGESITIAAGKTSGSVTIAAPSDDVHRDADLLTVRMTDASGGNFEKLDVSNAPVTTFVFDTINTTLLSLSASNTVSEGGQITYTATLTNPTDTAMTVKLSNGAIIKIAAGAASGSVNFAAPADTPYVDGGKVAAIIIGHSGGNFENVAVNYSPAVTTVKDTLTDTGLSLSASPEVAEGGSIVYTATLTNAAGTAMNVTLSNGAVIHIAKGALTGSVNYAAPKDDVYKDAGQVQASITKTSGGDFEKLVTDQTPAVTDVTDTINNTTVSLTATGSVAEGGTVVYTASVNAPVTGSPVVVTLSNHQTITIPVGASSASVNFTAPNDALAGGATLSVKIDGTTGGNYENLVANQTPAVTSVTDVKDTTTVSLSATESVAEGGSIVYTATLTNAAGTAMTVTLSNGAVIDIAKGATSGSVTFAAPKDDVYKDAGNVEVTIKETTGGNFENLVPSTVPAVTSVTDTIDTSTVTLTATSSVAEGGTVVYTASVGAPVTGSPVIVTLANNQTITIAVGESSGTVNAVVSNDVLNGHAPVITSITNVSGGNYENLVADKTPVSTTVTDTVDTTTVSLTATGNVNEGGSIVYTATLTNPAGTPVTVTLSNGATITIDAGKTTGTVKVDAPKDDVYKDAGTVEVTIKNATGGNFENLVPSTVPAVTNVADTTNTTRLTLSADLLVAEGSHITYTATLTHAAQTPVTVTLSNGESITIAAGKTSGSVTIAAPSDDVYRDADLLTVRMTDASGGNFEQLNVSKIPVTTIVVDTINTTLLSLSASNTVSEGGQITYTATLTNPTDTAMTVKLSNGAIINIAAGAASGSVNFAAPADTPYVDGGKVAAIIVDHSGGNFENVAVNYTPAVTTVTDTTDTTGLSLSATTSVAEGGSIVYTATLTNAAGTAMSVTLSNGAVIHIAKGALTGSVNYAAPSDDVYKDAGQVQASITKTSGGDFEKLVTDQTPAVTDVTDTINNTTVSLTATGSVAEGGTVVYTASVNAPVTGSPVVVTLSNHQTITIPVGASSASVNFTAPNDALAGGATLSVKIDGTTGGNYENLVANQTPAVTSVTDTTDTTNLTLSASGSVQEGGQIVYTATLSHAAGSDMTVTLSNGAIITILKDAVSGQVSVDAPKDDVYLDAGKVTASIDQVTGGKFESLVPDKSLVSTNITDTLNNVVAKLTVDNTSVTEGGQITYTVTLTNADGLSVNTHDGLSFTLTDGTVVNIAANQTSGSTIVPVPDNFYVDQPVTLVNQLTGVTVTGTNNYENLVLGTDTTSVTITDEPNGDANQVTVGIAANGDVTEGHAPTFTVSINRVLADDLTVTLNNGHTVVITAGQTSAIYAGNTNAEDVYTDPTSLTVHITGASVADKTFENLVIDNTAVTVNTTDTTNDVVARLTVDNTSVTEGGQITYTVTLTNAEGLSVDTHDGLSFTLTDGTVVNIAANQTSGKTVVTTQNNHYVDPSVTVVNQLTGVTGTHNYESLVLGTETTSVTITDNDHAPVSTGGAVTGLEDSTITLSWNDFHVTDVDNDSPLGITITQEAGGGVLLYNNVQVAVGQTISQADIAAGKLTFRPASNESGADGYGGSDTGNKAVDYAQIKFKPTDGFNQGNEATLKIDITPVADAPTLNVASNNVTSTGLIKEVWTGLAGLGTSGSGAASGTLKSVIDAAGNPNSSSTVSNVQSSGDVAAGTASKTSGLIYLEAGKTYTFSGTGDDSLLVTVGGKNVAAITWGAGGTLSGSFKPSTSGYYTLDIYHHNQNGAGNYDVNLKVDNGPVRDLSSAGVPLYTGVADLAASGVTVSDLHGSNGEGYYDGYKLNEAAQGTSVHLSAINTALTDTDGSESLSVKISGIPVGSVLSDGAGHSFSATATSGEANVTGWNLGSLTVTPPASYTGQFNLTVTSTSTEMLGGSAASVATIPVKVYPPAPISEVVATLTVDKTTVAEGGQITYTVTLSNKDGIAIEHHDALTFKLSDGTLVTVPANGASGSFTITAPDDILIGGQPTIVNKLESVSGADNFGQLTLAQNSLNTAVTDESGSGTPTNNLGDKVGITIIGNGAVLEDQAPSFTIKLDKAQNVPLTVTLSNGQTVTFAANETTKVHTLSPQGDDVYKDGSTVTLGISGATSAGTALENLVIGNPASVVVTDTTSEVVARLTVDKTTVAEGGQVTYTVTLTNVDGLLINNHSALTFTLTDGKTIIVGANSSTGSLTVTTADNVYTGGQLSLVNKLESVSGGDARFEQLTLDKTPLTTTITDEPSGQGDRITVSIEGNGSVAENVGAAFTVKINQALSDNLNVTLSNGGTVTIVAGQTQAIYTAPIQGEDVYKDGGALSLTVSSATVTGKTFENLVLSDTAGAVQITDTTNEVVARLTVDKTTVTEGGQVTYTVTLTNANGLPINNHSDLTFTLTDGKTITVPANSSTGSLIVTTADNVYTGGQSSLVNKLESVSGGDARFEQLTLDKTPLTTTITDEPSGQGDQTTVSISGSTSVTEGDTANYTVSLSNPAHGEVTLNIVYSGTAADGSDFTGVYEVKIPNGASSASFNVATLDDRITEGTENFVVRIATATGGNFENLAISTSNGSISTSIIDNDAPPVLDLDANNSSGATGANYNLTFTEGTTGPGLSITDSDFTIADSDSNMLTGATIVLTNRQPGDNLNLGNSVNGISINTNHLDGSITLILTGTATLANYIERIKNITFTNDSESPSAVPRTITVTVTDGGNYSNTATTTVTVVGVNDAPTAAPLNLTGTEDTPLILGWSTFGVSDVDSPDTSLGVKITGLPGDGKLQYLNGSTWTDLTPNQIISKTDIDAGKLRFMPDANESGANGNPSGMGNQKADYAQIQFQPTDGTLLGSTGTIKIDITPVADAPSLTVADNSVRSTGLTKEVWTGLSGLGTDGNGAPSSTLKSVIDAAGTPNSSSTVGNVQSSSDVTAGTASKTSGLIYLEAGKTYTFSGTGDDSLLVTIGGKNVASALWGNGGAITGTGFVPTTSGYYTLDIYHHNQSGPGSYDVNLSVNGGAAVDLSSAGVPLYTGVADLAASGVTVSDLHGTNGEGYYDGYKLNTGAEGTSVHLSAITTARTDVDGSESLSVKISGIPAGSVLTDGAGHTFTATATSGEANVTDWNLGSLTVTPPAYYNGQFNLTVTSTSTETLGGSAISTATIPVTVYPAVYNPITATAGDDVRDGTVGNDIVVADIGGLTVIPGQNYNLAFMVDSSGSMSASSVTSAKNSLVAVFTSLIASATSQNASAGTVKVFLVDFDSQVNKSISIDLSKAGALDALKGVLNSMQSGGYTNYEDVFKTTANWFKGPDALSNTNAINLTYFITDGEPTAYTKDEQTNPLVVDFKSSGATDLYLDNVLKQGSYTPGTEFRMIIGGESRVVVDSSGALYKWTEKSTNNWTSEKYSSNLQVHAQGDGTFELSDYAGSGYADSTSASNAAAAFALFAAANSKVQAIGVNGDVSVSDLAPYNTTDGKPLANINPQDLANAILGHSEATLPGKDTINGGDGNDIIFGDLVSFNGVTGEGYTALQAFVGKETGVETNKVTSSNVHQYVTEHYSALDVSGAHDGDDTLLGGAGNDIIFGQGGADKLYGGNGNDILLGGTGNDLLNGDAGNDILFGGAGTDTLDGGAGNDTLLGGAGNDTLIGGLGGDTFVWKAGDTGTDVIKDFNASQGDRIDLRDLLQNESGSTIDNFLKITTVGGVSSLEVNSAGQFNSNNAAAAKADVTIKLEGNNWSSANLHNLIAGSDPTIKVDHNNS